MMRGRAPSTRPLPGEKPGEERGAFRRTEPEKKASEKREAVDARWNTEEWQRVLRGPCDESQRRGKKYNGWGKKWRREEEELDRERLLTWVGK